MRNRPPWRIGELIVLRGNAKNIMPRAMIAGHVIEISTGQSIARITAGVIYDGNGRAVHSDNGIAAGAGMAPHAIAHKEVVL